MSFIFQNGRLLNPLEHLDTAGSIKVADDGIIEEVVYGNKVITASPEDRIIDLNGQIIAPGLFDMHCHFREPGQEYKETLESGSNAAAAGGFTGVVYLMPQGGIVEPYERNRQRIADICCAQGWQYSPRLHVDLWGNGWGK